MAHQIQLIATVGSTGMCLISQSQLSSSSGCLNISTSSNKPLLKPPRRYFPNPPPPLPLLLRSSSPPQLHGQSLSFPLSHAFSGLLHPRPAPFLLLRRRLDRRPPPGLRPPRRSPPQGRRVLLPRPILRDPRGPDRSPLLRAVRGRARLLRPRGARQPQLRRAPGSRRVVAGGALSVATRQGDLRCRFRLRRHPLRHRRRSQAAPCVFVRRPAGLPPGNRRCGGSRVRTPRQERLLAAEITTTVRSLQ